MRIPDWRKLALEEGILVEPPRDDQRVVVWLPDGSDREYRYWERLGTSARPEIRLEHGICLTPATSMRARQRLGGGLFGKLAQTFRGGPKNDTWALPDGQSAERCGERRIDLTLAWPDDAAGNLEEAAARGIWPGLTRFQQLGDRLFLIAGIEPVAKKSAQAMTDEPGCPTAMTQQILDAARQAGDRPCEAAALTDLGIIAMNEGDMPRSVANLDRALLLTRELRDRKRETDVINNLGYALLVTGQVAAAREMLEQAVAFARETGDPYAEKIALERLGLAHTSARDPVKAMICYDHALELTRRVGDKQQEAKILWSRAITYAELNQRDEAIASGQESIDLLRKLGKPEASWYGAQLQRYRMDLSGLAGDSLGPQEGAPAGADQVRGPGVLRMAVSATKAMMRFIGSGLKTTTADVQQKRIGTCNACEHHTGVRCRICGCFTNVKTRMAHEECPIGKWPA